MMSNFPETIYLCSSKTGIIDGNDYDGHWCDRFSKEDADGGNRFPEYRRADLPPTLTVEQRDAIVAGMIAIIKKYSEDVYLTSWHKNIEFIAWSGEVYASVYDNLKRMSLIINGWIHVPVGADDPQFIPMDEWLRLFEA